MAKGTSSSAVMTHLESPEIIFSVQPDRSDQKHPSCRDIFKVKARKSLLKAQLSQKVYVKKRKKRRKGGIFVCQYIFARAKIPGELSLVRI